VGLHQCPSEKKGKVVPRCARHVPSHVPVHAQSAAKPRGCLPTAMELTAETDSPLEQSGFELPVPRAVEERCRDDKLRSRARVRWLVWGALPCPLRSRWDREFESPLLQQRVCELSVPERRTDRRENTSDLRVCY
jgi:hypothetical protein